MNANQKTAEPKDRKMILSTLWIFAVLNYIYADVFSIYFNPSAQAEALAFVQGSGLVVLAFGIVMQTAMAMVVLSRVLSYRANRWANILVGILHTTLVAWSLTEGVQTPAYIFSASIEIACTLFIVWYAWSWRNPQAVALVNRQVLQGN